LSAEGARLANEVGYLAKTKPSRAHTPLDSPSLYRHRCLHDGTV